MKMHLLLFLVIIAWSCNSVKENKSTSIRIPGEFEPQSAIWLGLATAEVGGYDSTTIQMIKALNGTAPLNLIIEHDSLFPEGKRFFSRLGLDTASIHLIYQSPTDIWVRDPGPVFGITSDGELAIADFKYTNYANVIPDSIGEKAKAHEGIDRDIAGRLGAHRIESGIAMEGGAFETNGKGSLIQVENITLKRNPHLNKQQIEQDFKDHFNITEVIWLPAGVVDDPHNFSRIDGMIFGVGTGGHTDELVRFANDSTILLAWVSEEEKDTHPINKLNYQVLATNYEILKNYTRTDGSHFKIIKVPHPDPKTYELVIDKESLGPKSRKKYNLQDGDTITMAYASSYMNYLITDKIILLPQYGSGSQSDAIKEKDDRVMAIFRELYPDRKIVGINPTELNSHGGGMHCRYQPQPKLP